MMLKRKQCLLCNMIIEGKGTMYCISCKVDRKKEIQRKYSDVQKEKRKEENRIKKEKKKIIDKEYYLNLKEKTCSKCKKILSIENFSLKYNKNSSNPFRSDCKECVNLRLNNRKKENPEKYKNYKKEYNKKNKNNQEYIKKRRQRVKAYKYANPEKVKSWDKERKKLMSENSDGTLTKEVLIKIQEELVRCPYCGKRLDKIKNHLDHMQPLTKGGIHGKSNLIICCEACNLSKSNNDFNLWMSTLPKIKQKALNIYLNNRSI